LLLEDIGKRPRFAKVISKCRVISKVIMNHAELKREYSDVHKGLELDKYCETRFGTAILLCESIKANKDAINFTAVSTAFTSWMQSKKRPREGESSLFDGTSGRGLSHNELGTLTREALASEDFWININEFLTVTANVYKLMRVTDSGVSCSGEVYMRMCALLGDFEHNEFSTDEGRQFSLDDEEHSAIKAAVQDRWDMMHSEIHAAAFVLNPRYHHCQSFTGDAMAEHDELVSKWVPSDKILIYKEQLSLYKKKAGVFDSKNAILFSPEALKANPHAWWDDWGSGKKEVHDFAVRVHAQPTGIGMAERCWKAYSYIHNAKRNRMCSTRACKLVRTHYNLRLISKRKNPRYEEEHLAGLEIESQLNTYEESP
jgi:hypothetical protein